MLIIALVLSIVGAVDVQMSIQPVSSLVHTTTNY